MKDLDEKWEAIIYDTYAAMVRHAKPICELVNKHGTLEQKAAYRDGIYAQSVRLGVFLGQDALDRGKARHAQIAIKVKAAMAHLDSENVKVYHGVKRGARNGVDTTALLSSSFFFDITIDVE